MTERQLRMIRNLTIAAIVNSAAIAGLAVAVVILASAHDRHPPRHQPVRSRAGRAGAVRARE